MEDNNHNKEDDNNDKNEDKDKEEEDQEGEDKEEEEDKLRNKYLPYQIFLHCCMLQENFSPQCAA